MPSLPRAFVTALLAALVGAAPAPAQTGSMPTTWQINGNGYTGLLVLQQVDPTTHAVRATLLGTPATGFLVGRHLVLHRHPQESTQIWDGWLLEPALGAAGLPSYRGQPILAGTFSQSGTGQDGVYPWYGVAQGPTQPPPPPTPTPTPTPTGNLITNGSFEQGPRRYSVNAGIPGWTVTRESVDMVTTYWQQVHGEVSLDLAGSPGNGAIAQTVATVPGRTYEVSFLMAGNPGAESPLKQMRVHAAGQAATFSVNVQGRSTQNMEWQRMTWRFQAAQASTTLTFENLGPNRTSGIALDDVRVVAR